MLTFAQNCLQAITGQMADKNRTQGNTHPCKGLITGVILIRVEALDFEKNRSFFLFWN